MTDGRLIKDKSGNTQIQIHKYTYKNTNTQTQIQIHKYTNTSYSDRMVGCSIDKGVQRIV